MTVYFILPEHKQNTYSKLLLKTVKIDLNILKIATLTIWIERPKTIQNADLQALLIETEPFAINN